MRDTQSSTDRNGTAQANLRFNTGSTGQRARIGLNNSGNHLYYDMVQSNSDHIFQVNGSTEAMRIVGSTANVGIGTSSTSARLHVALESSVEQLAAFTVPDAADDYLRIRNRTGVAGRYAPMIVGYSVSQTDLEPLTLAAWTNSGGDSGGRSMMNFDVRRADSSTDITVRPLFTWSNNGAARMLMKADGNLGIGTTAPSSKLTVAGDIAPSTNNAFNLGTSTSNRWNTLYYSALVQGSDDRIKENIQPLEYGLEQLLQLEPISYVLIPPFDSIGDVLEGAISGTQFGLSAQSLQDVLPQLVSEDGDSLNLLGVRYIELIPVLINAIKEQHAQITGLTSELQQFQQGLAFCCGDEYTPQQRIQSSGGQNVEEVLLFRNDPNPFSAWTNISYRTEDGRQLSLIITDVSGRIIKRLHLYSNEGTVKVYGSDLGSGQYFYSLVSGNHILRTERMIVVR